MRLGGAAANTCGAEHLLCPSTETMVLVCSGQSGPRGFELLPLCAGRPGSGRWPLFPGIVLSWHRYRMSLSLYSLPQEGQSISPETGAINSLDSRWRRKRRSGKTHRSLINTASHRRNDKTTRTPCFSGTSKSPVKYEMPGCLFSAIQITCSLSS